LRRRRSQVHTLRALHESAQVLLNVLDVFITEPLLDWIKPVSGRRFEAACGVARPLDGLPCVVGAAKFRSSTTLRPSGTTASSAKSSAGSVMSAEVDADSDEKWSGASLPAVVLWEGVTSAR
jgi:hypothetical protein